MDNDTYKSQTETARDPDFVRDAETALRTKIAENIGSLIADVQYDQIRARVQQLITLRKDALDRVTLAQADLAKAQQQADSISKQLNDLAAGDLSILDKATNFRCPFCQTYYSELVNDYCPNCNLDKRGRRANQLLSD